MPQERNFCLHHLAFGEIGFIIRCFGTLPKTYDDGEDLLHCLLNLKSLLPCITCLQNKTKKITEVKIATQYDS